MKKKTFLIVGVVMLIIASVMGVFAIGMYENIEVLDPEKDAIETLDFRAGGDSKTVTLDEGEYTVWTDEDERVGSLSVTDVDGRSVFEWDKGETIRIDESGSAKRSYDKLGDLDIDERGSHTFETDERCTLYITEHHDFFEFFWSLGSFILIMIFIVPLGIGGIALIVIGVFSKDAQNRGRGYPPPPTNKNPPHQQRYQQNPPPPPTNKNPPHQQRYQQNPPPPPPEEKKNEYR